MEKKSYINNANWKRKLIKWKATEKKNVRNGEWRNQGKKKREMIQKEMFCIESMAKIRNHSFFLFRIFLSSFSSHGHQREDTFSHVPLLIPFKKYCIYSRQAQEINPHDWRWAWGKCVLENGSLVFVVGVKDEW